MARLPLSHQPKYQLLLDSNWASISAWGLTYLSSARKWLRKTSIFQAPGQLYWIFDTWSMIISLPKIISNLSPWHQGIALKQLRLSQVLRFSQFNWIKRTCIRLLQRAKFLGSSESIAHLHITTELVKQSKYRTKSLSVAIEHRQAFLGPNDAPGRQYFMKINLVIGLMASVMHRRLIYN